MMTRRQSAGRPALPGTSDGRFRHILVPTDLTARTEKALQLAGQLVSRAGARVTLLHVIESIEGLALNEVKPVRTVNGSRHGLGSRNTNPRGVRGAARTEADIAPGIPIVQRRASPMRTDPGAAGDAWRSLDV
jgi:nucleotide-binding universal stress UspA family protein